MEQPSTWPDTIPPSTNERAPLFNRLNQRCHHAGTMSVLNVKVVIGLFKLTTITYLCIASHRLI